MVLTGGTGIEDVMAIECLPANGAETQGTWAFQTSSNLYMCGYWGNFTTHADGDTYTWTLKAPAGKYKVLYYYWKGTNFGIAKVDVDGVERISVDAYAGSSTYNQLEASSSFDLVGSGDHTIALKVDGKNASSTDHRVSSLRLVLIPVSS